jgi:hypothetical protein
VPPEDAVAVQAVVEGVIATEPVERDVRSLTRGRARGFPPIFRSTEARRGGESRHLARRSDMEQRVKGPAAG